MSSIGFIGLGIMGQGMAHNLAKAGRRLIVWNRSQEKAQAFAKEAGGEAVSTPKEVVSKCDITYMMLSDLQASEAVYNGEDGILAGVKAGKSIIDCATLTPAKMKANSSSVLSLGGRFLEAPVSGSKGPAAQGQLVFLCAGEEELYKQVHDDLDVMGKASYFFGNVGKGTEMKLVVNMTMGSMLNCLAEGLALATAADLPQKDLLEVLDLGAMKNPMFALKGPMMVDGNYPPQFPLKHAQKDMRFAIDLGDQLGQALPVAAAANEQFKRVRNEHGDDDFSAVYSAVRSPPSKA